MADSKDDAGASSNTANSVDTIPVHTGAPRQDMIDTAVKFLHNPKVKDSPVSRKTAFLEQKGLSSDEIQQALLLAGGGGSGGTAQGTNVITPAVGGHAGQVAMVPSPSLTWKDYFIGAVVASTASYGLALAVKNYIIPKFGWPGEDTSKQLQELNTSLATLQEDYSEKAETLQNTVDATNKTASTVMEELEKVTRRVGQLEVGAPKQSSITDIKSEISSIKSLLLNRRSFAAAPEVAPQTSSRPSSAIPAWQRVPLPSSSVNGSTGFKNGGSSVASGTSPSVPTFTQPSSIAAVGTASGVTLPSPSDTVKQSGVADINVPSLSGPKKDGEDADSNLEISDTPNPPSFEKISIDMDAENDDSTPKKQSQFATPE